MTTGLQKSAQETLQRLVDQIERLDEEIKGLTEDRGDKYAEAKSQGFDVKILRKIIRMRKQDKTEREEEQAIIDTYLHALGDLADLPLGKYAIERDMARA